MTDPSGSNRRDFLTGKAAQKALRQRADEVTDAILGETDRTPPRAQETIRLETRAMACQWAVVMNPGQSRQIMVASDALDFVHEVEQQLTVYRDNSDISGVNRLAAESPQRLAPEIFRFLQVCRNIWTATEGTFDPAMGALIQLWREARRSGQIPTQGQISEGLSRTGMQHVLLDPERETIAFDTPGLSLDFGAIGKGYALDIVAAHLESEGIEHFITHGGHSSIAARGDHGGHTGWPVGIKNPLFTEQRYYTILLRDQGMSTSGSNVQFFRHQGKRYGHLIDPRNGWPAEGLLSVTVVAPSAAEADALSTAFYVMGLDKARQYCDDHHDVGAILVPMPAGSRKLEPVICNLPPDQLFFEETSRDRPDASTADG